MFKFKRMNRFNVKGGVLENPVALTSLHRHYGVTRGPKGYRAQHPTPKGENALSHPDIKRLPKLYLTPMVPPSLMTTAVTSRRFYFL